MANLIAELSELIAKDNGILFVGANLGAAENSLTGQIAEALASRIDYQRPDRSLAAVARDFEVLQGRSGLILALREELARLQQNPSPIHQLVADAVLPTTKVITTRFDQVLERALDQFQKPYVLIVRDTDAPFFDESKITLIKIQGDVGQPDSLVITEDDVESFVQNLPTLGDIIRTFFATKTLIFLGYDLHTAQFKRFFHQVTRNVSIYRRTAYAIVPENEPGLDGIEKRYWENQNVQLVVRDPLHFLEELADGVKQRIHTPQPTDANPLEQMAQPDLPAQPYKALDSFSGADAAIFAGRAEESQRLTNRILAHRLSIVYGESGSGKTSLLQAGVRPRLAERRALLVTTIPQRGQPLPQLLFAALHAAAENTGLPLVSATDPKETVRTWQRALDGPIVLAIDQFEQFFVVYSKAEQQEAIQAVETFLQDRSLDLRLVLVLREDFLGRLQLLAEQIPHFLDVRFRLDRLGREAAAAAIVEPARLYNIQWEPALVNRLLDELVDPQVDGVAPPQLQIICQRLYEAVTDDANRSTGTAQSAEKVEISLDLYTKLGGAEKILGDYLNRALATLPEEHRSAARTMLASLVNSSGVKQRLSAPELARISDIGLELVVRILDDLTGQRIVRRFTARPDADTLPDPVGGAAYELAHDYLVRPIWQWLGDDFWAGQKVREILRQALPEWRERRRLLPVADLQLTARQAGRLRVTADEAALIYASAVAEGLIAEDTGSDGASRPTDGLAVWQTELDTPARWAVIAPLTQDGDPQIRQRAIALLATFDGADADPILTQAALSDPDPQVQERALDVVARLAQGGETERARALIHRLAEAVNGRRSLIRLRDRTPAVHDLLPGEQRSAILRQVRLARLRRHWGTILSTLMRGLQGGFWGLGLGMGLFLALAQSETRRGASFGILMGVYMISIAYAGVMGAFSVGAAALSGSLLDAMADRVSPRLRWGVLTATGTIFMSIAFGLISFTSPGASLPNIVSALLRGGLVGLALAGVAAAPLSVSRWVHAGATAAAGLAIFVSLRLLGLHYSQISVSWLSLIGLAAGTGFFVALHVKDKAE